ncbi:MAG: PKD domain-containing protein [Pedobacter sp.]|nr:MAG: PKD domain-containing protein [Pedobacter sp.]
MKNLNFLLIALSISTMVVLQSCKDNDQIGDPVVNNSEPIANFNWTGPQLAPAELVFTNASLDADSFKWDFGNGSHSSDRQPTKVTFGLPGNYEVILTASKGNKKSLIKKTIVISPDDSPLAHFSYSFKDNKSNAPATLVLVNNSQNAVSYEWEINNSLYGTKTPSYIILNTPGDYVIKLIAINGTRRSPVYQQTVSVMPSDEPRSGFSLAYHPFPYSVDEEIQLVNTSLNSDSWQWTFGNGGPASTTEQHPIIKFPRPGDYPISLIAKKGANSAPAKTITIRINP